MICLFFFNFFFYQSSYSMQLNIRCFVAAAQIWPALHLHKPYLDRAMQVTAVNEATETYLWGSCGG